ncbi:hypothetical protein D3C75_943740 [compost metagenome]
MHRLSQPGVDLPGLVHLLVNLPDLAADSGNGFVNGLEGSKGLHHLVVLLLQAFFSPQHIFLKIRHAVLQVTDDPADMYGGVIRLHGQMPDLVRNDGKTFARSSCPCRFNGGVQG